MAKKRNRTFFISRSNKIILVQNLIEEFPQFIRQPTFTDDDEINGGDLVDFLNNQFEWLREVKDWEE